MVPTEGSGQYGQKQRRSTGIFPLHTQAAGLQHVTQLAALADVTAQSETVWVKTGLTWHRMTATYACCTGCIARIGVGGISGTGSRLVKISETEGISKQEMEARTMLFLDKCCEGICTYTLLKTSATRKSFRSNRRAILKFLRGELRCHVGPRDNQDTFSV